MTGSISAEHVFRSRTRVVLAYGFRPFFLATAAWAIATICLWVFALAGLLPQWLSAVDLAWHQHEMLFGVLAAAAAGFVLTAFPEWTKSDPLTGDMLGWLVGLWVAGRVAMLIDSRRIELALMAAAFLPALWGVAISVLMRIRPPRLSLFVVLLGMLAMLAVWWQAARIGMVGIEPTSLALPALLVYAALVTVATGRIVPIVSQLALRDDAMVRVVRMEPASSDVAAWTLVALAIAVVIDLPAEITGWVAFAATFAQLHRLCEWQIGLSGRRAYLWPLHLASALITAAAGAIGLSCFGAPIPGSSIAHALGMGGAALTTLTVMTIAGLLHTGRALRLPAGAACALAMLALAVLLRAAAPWLSGDAARHAVDAAGALWIGAFALYLIAIGPMLVSRRIDGRPG